MLEITYENFNELNLDEKQLEKMIICIENYYSEKVYDNSTYQKLQWVGNEEENFRWYNVLGTGTYCSDNSQTILDAIKSNVCYCFDCFDDKLYNSGNKIYIFDNYKEFGEWLVNISKQIELNCTQNNKIERK